MERDVLPYGRFVRPWDLQAPGQHRQVTGAVSVMGLREGDAVVLVCPLTSPPAAAVSSWRQEQHLGVTLYTLLDSYWLPSELQAGEWEGRTWRSCAAVGGIGEDLMCRAKRTHCSWQRSPSRELTLTTVE